jgi:hypothetical protein
MTLWRKKKKTERGLLSQVCVWVSDFEEGICRRIFDRIGEQSQRGSELRMLLLNQLDRRRTIGAKWEGGALSLELDLPLVGPWWALRHIGGRILGPYNTHIELDPEEAKNLKTELNKVCHEVISAWLKDRKLSGTVRDTTGVHIGEGIKLDPKRPQDEDEFAKNEATIAQAVWKEALASKKPPVEDASIVEFKGFDGYPSYCQIAHRRHNGRVQFALIHMEHTGKRPTNMFEGLATLFGRQFYPDTDASLIDWFDVFPPGLYELFDDVTISAVSMQQANGVYSDPTWSRVDPTMAADMRDFLLEPITRVKHLKDKLQLKSKETARFS